jgi:hypothetical protein
LSSPGRLSSRFSSRFSRRFSRRFSSRFSRRATPPEVVATAGLGSGERVLAAISTQDGIWLLGTRDAFTVVRQGERRRIPWELIHRADWDRDEERFLVSEVGEFGRPRAEHSFAVPEPGLLLELVRERVTASVVLSRRVRVRGGTGLLVVGRKAPSGGGDITWTYEFDPGVDPAEPAVMEAAEAALRAARADIGA